MRPKDIEDKVVLFDSPYAEVPFCIYLPMFRFLAYIDRVPYHITSKSIRQI